MGILNKWFPHLLNDSGSQDQRVSKGQSQPESQGQTEGRQIERLLRVALAESTTEDEFNRLLARMIRQDGYEDDLLVPRAGAGLVYRLLEEHRGLGQDWRSAAKRLVAYLPRFYGYKSNWESDKRLP
jgi:hypothetical protein